MTTTDMQDAQELAELVMAYCKATSQTPRIEDMDRLVAEAVAWFDAFAARFYNERGNGRTGATDWRRSVIDYLANATYDAFRAEAGLVAA